MALAPIRALTNTTTQSLAFLPIPEQCICAFQMSFWHIAGAFAPSNRGQFQTPIESSEFLPLHQLGQAASEDLLTYLIMTAELGLPLLTSFTLLLVHSNKLKEILKPV